MKIIQGHALQLGQRDYTAIVGIFCMNTQGLITMWTARRSALVSKGAAVGAYKRAIMNKSDTAASNSKRGAHLDTIASH